MTFQEFIEAILEAIRKELKEDQEVIVKKVRKNNNMVFQGLMFSTSKSNVVPTVYLDEYYPLFQKGISIEEIVKRIRMIFEEAAVKEKMDFSFFRDFEKVKDRIIYRLVNAKMNQESLKAVPHIPFWDLAICFSYAFTSEELAEGLIMINNEHLKAWGVDQKCLMEYAEKNTPRLFPLEFKAVFAIAMESLGIQSNCKEVIEPMYVISNKQKHYGAAVILYQDTLKFVAEQLGENFYLLPSSVHEMLVLRESIMDDNQDNSELLRELVRSVNFAETSADIILSDQPFYYDCEKQQLKQL